MAGLQIPTLKQLERDPIHAFEWLASLEQILRDGLAELPESDIRYRRNIEKRLKRLQERREEFKASLKPTAA